MSPIFVGNMCVIVSRPIEIVTLRKNDETPNWVVEFLRLKDTFRKQKWKSSKDLRLQMAQIMECNHAVRWAHGMELACVVVLVEWLIIRLKKNNYC